MCVNCRSKDSKPEHQYSIEDWKDFFAKDDEFQSHKRECVSNQYRDFNDADVLKTKVLKLERKVAGMDNCMPSWGALLCGVAGTLITLAIVACFLSPVDKQEEEPKEKITRVVLYKG